MKDCKLPSYQNQWCSTAHKLSRLTTVLIITNILRLTAGGGGGGFDTVAATTSSSSIIPVYKNIYILNNFHADK